MRFPKRGAALLAGVLGLGACYAAADAAELVPGVISFQNSVSPTPPPVSLAPTTLREDLPSITEEGPSPNPATAAASLDKLQKQVEAHKGELGVLVVNRETGEVIVKNNENTPYIPASTTKLFTSSAAISLLKPEERLKTYTALEANNLYLKSEGDLMLAPEQGNQNEAMGYAGLGDLAKKTAEKLKSHPGTFQLNVDDTAIAGPERNPIWKTQDVQGYVGNTTDMAVHQGRPNPARARNFSQTAQNDAAKEFQKQLEKYGVKTNSDIKYAPIPPKATPLAEVESATNRTLLRYAEKNSDNTLMEEFCRRLAPALKVEPNYATTAVGVVKYLGEQGVDTKNVTLHDCSGLDINNRVTAASLVSLIKHDLEEARTQPLIGMLPVAAWDGTLKNRFEKPEGRGRIRAKTGSLPGVSSMAGIIRTKTGHELIFSVLVNKFEPGSVYQVRADIDDFLTALSEQ
ncbi:D-alanyl-D-alanine carboxypeptidase/D-alanyl-D-alanine-endopeptidase [Actinomycetaceae bacterium TAE3-ERU4]|nr:D-alanyl-D-alanine carboxypeptidase/D-alanyl-D-alanine-endopeptidase [Actinomycetaceae bacterium TAE3-ERU4]